MDQPELTYCVVDTSQRELLSSGLDAIARERERCRSLPEGWCSTTARATARPSGPGAPGGRRGDRAGSAHAARARTIPSCCGAPRGRYGLLLNEDSELRPGATLALWRALREHPRAALAGARLLRPDGRRQPCAWRFPSPATALAFALGLQRLLVVQSRGEEVREVDWCQSAALLVRREAAAQVDYLDPDFFVYSDEVDFARRLRDAGWQSLYVPGAVAVHHEQLSNDPAAGGPGSWNWRATATSTCASTTPRPPPRPCAG